MLKKKSLIFTGRVGSRIRRESADDKLRQTRAEKTVALPVVFLMFLMYS